MSSLLAVAGLLYRWEARCAALEAAPELPDWQERMDRTVRLGQRWAAESDELAVAWGCGTAELLEVQQAAIAAGMTR